MIGNSCNETLRPWRTLYKAALVRIPAGLKRFLANQRKAMARRKATRPGSMRGRYDQILADVVRELQNSPKNPRRRAGRVVCANRRAPRPYPYLDETCCER